MSLVGSSFKNPRLVKLLSGPRVSKKHKESLCLLWFVHNILLPKDYNNNITHDLVKFSEDVDAFNNYPWGADSYELTAKYLLNPLVHKNTLKGFPWAFMVNTYLIWYFLIFIE